MDTSEIASSVFVPEPKDEFEFLQDSHTHFLFEGFKIHPRTEKFPDVFELIVKKSHSVTYEVPAAFRENVNHSMSFQVRIPSKTSDIQVKNNDIGKKT